MTAVQATNIRGVEPEWNSCLQTAAQSRRRISLSVAKIQNVSEITRNIAFHG